MEVTADGTYENGVVTLFHIPEGVADGTNVSVVFAAAATHQGRQLDILCHSMHNSMDGAKIVADLERHRDLW